MNLGKMMFMVLNVAIGHVNVNWLHTYFLLLLKLMLYNIVFVGCIE